jgi:ATP adenylyltransferase
MKIVKYQFPPESPTLSYGPKKPPIADPTPANRGRISWLAFPIGSFSAKILLSRCHPVKGAFFMSKLVYAPWRMEYIKGHERQSDCIFCSALLQEDGLENLIVWRGQLAYVILNRFPYNNGHLMIVPNQHQPSLEMLETAVQVEIMELTSQAIRTLREIYHPQGFNIGMNIGTAAGAGIAEHVHLHLLPRWTGDTNFMSTVAETRVLPEDLATTYRRVRAAWLELSNLP